MYLENISLINLAKAFFIYSKKEFKESYARVWTTEKRLFHAYKHCSIE